MASINRRELPTAPSPEASVEEVQSFFRDYFLVTGVSSNLDEATNKAKHLKINGLGLYLSRPDSF